MRGTLDIAQWLVLMLLVSIIVLAAVMGTVQNFFNDAVKTSARIYARDISGIINLMQSSPNATTHEYTMPPLDCEISIGPSVKVAIRGEKQNAFVSELIRTSVSVDHSELACNKNSQTTLVFSRRDDNVTVRVA